MKNQKIIITLLCAAVLLAAGVCSVPPLVRAAEEAKRLNEAREAQPELTRVAQAVNASEADDREQRRQLVRYANWVNVYQPTQEQQDEISQMIADGADVDVLLDICVFWEDTNDPFTLVGQLYDARPDDETLAEFSDHLLWITNAYDRLKSKEDEALTKEEIIAYQEQGLSTPDVLIADRLARGGSDVRAVLVEKATGASWQAIILPETNGVASIAEDTEEIDGNDLLDSLILSRKTGRPAAEFLAARQEEETVLDACNREQAADTLAELQSLGLVEQGEGAQS